MHFETHSKEAAEKRLEEIQNEISILNKEANELRNIIQRLSYTENTKKYLDGISVISEENTMSIRLTKKTKTTPIIDSFYHSNKEFLIIERLFTVITKKYNQYLRISLIVRKSIREIISINNGLTMTDLKKSSGEWFFVNGYNKDDRMYSLMEEVFGAIDKENQSKQAIPFMNPIRLGGQTFSNQTGFGSEYNGSDLVSQGTLYGETTGFFIIGVTIS